MKFRKKLMTFLLCSVLSCSMTVPAAAVSKNPIDHVSSTHVKNNTFGKNTTNGNTSGNNTDNSNTSDGTTSDNNNSNNNTSNNNTSDNTKDTSKKVKWPTPPKASKLSCESAVVIDAATGMVLFEQKANKKQYPASITKILTTLVALENSSLGETVTFSHDAIFGIEFGSSNVAVNVGEKLTMEQCLYAIMLESANEVCLGVAEHIAGSISSYVDMMNAKVAELGLKNTHFANPNGLHDDNHYTSAYDIAMISREALKNDTFRKITGTKTYVLPPTNKQKLKRYWTNHHDMLSGRRYPAFMTEDCFGGKTGYTSMAQSTLVTFEKRNDMELICVVMRANSAKNFPNFNQYTDTQLLFDYAFENFTSYNMNEAENAAETEDSGLFTKFNPVFNAETSPIHLGEGGKVVLPNGVKLTDAKQTVTYDTNITLQTGENKIGQVTYTYGDKTVGSTNIYYTVSADTPVLTQGKPIEAVKSKNVRPEIQRIILRIVIIVVGVIVLAGVVIGIVLFQKKRKEENSAYERQKRLRRIRKRRQR